MKAPKPLISRYARVHLVLAEDPLLKKQLSPKLVTVSHKNNIHEFPPEVVQITEMLYALGVDTESMSKVDIVNAAHDILIRHSPPELPSAVKIKPKTPMEKSIADIIKDRITVLGNRRETLEKQAQEVSDELRKCEIALAALHPKPDPEPDQTNNRVINERMQETHEFSRFVVAFLKSGPKSVQEIATARSIETKPCYSRLFRLKKKGLIEIDNNIVSKFNPEGSP